MNTTTINLIFSILKQLGLIAIGAMIPTIISYFATKKREQTIIKINFQMKASEELIDGVKRYTNKLDKTNIQLSVVADKYNSYIQTMEKANLNEIKNNNSKNDIDIAKDVIFNDVNAFVSSWNKSIEDFSNIINILESKQIIFNRFIELKELLISQNEKTMQIYNKIIDIYYSKLYNQLINSNIISPEDNRMLKQLEDDFKKSKSDMLCYIYDLRVATQNEFFRKLFKYKVPIRKQQEGEVPVYDVNKKNKKA